MASANAVEILMEKIVGEFDRTESLTEKHKLFTQDLQIPMS